MIPAAPSIVRAPFNLRKHPHTSTAGGVAQGKKKKETCRERQRRCWACPCLRSIAVDAPGHQLLVPSLHFTEMVESSTVDPAMHCSPLVSAGCRDGPFSAADRMRQVVSTRFSYACRASSSSGLHVLFS
jgi:hypothetical protein